MGNASRAAERRPLFSGPRKREILAQVVGQPSGTVVELGGFNIDLVAIAFADEMAILDALETFGSLFDDVMAKRITTYAAVAPLVIERYRALKDLLKKIVRQSVTIDDDGGDEAFEEWFAALPMIATMQALLSAALSSNGLDTLGKRMATLAGPALARATAAPSPSTSPQDT